MCEAFQNTARPTTEAPDNKRTTFVTLQGAGLINVQRVINSTLSVKPSRIALNDMQHCDNLRDKVQTQIIKITNNDSTKRTYTITHELAVSVRGLNNTGRAAIASELNGGSVAVTFSDSSVVLESKKTVELKLTSLT
jgi:hypothetical protein